MCHLVASFGDRVPGLASCGCFACRRETANGWNSNTTSGTGSVSQSKQNGPQMSIIDVISHNSYYCTIILNSPQYFKNKAAAAEFSIPTKRKQ
jgi:hypothetical protein